MKKNFYIVFALFLSVELLSNTSSTFLIDRHFSPYAGAEDIILAQEGLLRLEDFLIKPSRVTELEFQYRVARLADLICIWLPINYLGMVTQHEFFGHGYQIRSIGFPPVKVSGYKIEVPPPYGSGGGATLMKVASSLTTSELIDIDIAGVQATGILSNRIWMHDLQTKVLDGRAGALYNQSLLDVVFYTFETTILTKTNKGNDIASYHYLMNRLYPTLPISIKQSKRQCLITLLNPLLFYKIWSEIQYVAVGKPFSFPMIKIGDAKYLPAFRFNYAPYGPESYFENFLTIDSKRLYFYYKWGKLHTKGHFGLGIEAQNILEWRKGALGCRFDYFHQFVPVNDFSALTAITISKTEALALYKGVKTQNGAAITFFGSHELFSPIISLLVELGYKTNGYIPGQSLNAGPIVRLGANFVF